jgi:hypothetical protein
MLLNWLRRWQKHQELTPRSRTERRRRKAKRRGNCLLRLEPLEDRTLLTVTASLDPSNGLLTVQSDNNNENITLRLDPNDNSQLQVLAEVPLASGPTMVGEFPVTGIVQIKVNGGSGDDALSVDNTNGIVPLHIAFDAVPGTNGLVLYGSFDKETDELSGPTTGTFRFNEGQGPVIDYSNVTTIYDDTVVNSYEALDLISGPGQELGVQSDYFSSVPMTLTGSQTLISGKDITHLVSFAPRRLFQNKGSVTVVGPSTATAFDVTLPDSRISPFQPSTPPLTLQGQSGQDTFNINYALNSISTPLASAYPITVTDTGTAQLSTLNINDTNNLDVPGGTYDIRSNVIERTGEEMAAGSPTPGPFMAYPDDVAIAYSNVGLVNINGGNNGYVYNVSSTAAGTTTTINAGAGNDHVNVAETVTTLGNLAGPLVVNGGVGTSLVWDDTQVTPTNDGRYSYTPVSTSYEISLASGPGSVLTRTSVAPTAIPDGPSEPPAAPPPVRASVQFNNLASLSILDGAGSIIAPHFTLLSTAGAGQVGITATGLETIDIGQDVPTSVDNANMDGIGNVAITGAPVLNLNLNDQLTQNFAMSNFAQQNNVVFAVNAGSVTRTNNGSNIINGIAQPFIPVPVATITYGNVLNLNLHGGTSGNVFDVLGTDANTTTRIDAGDGSTSNAVSGGARVGDTIKVGDAAHGLDGIPTLDVVGATGTSLILDDEKTHNAISSFGADDPGVYDVVQNSPIYTVTDQGVQRTNTLTDTEESVDNGTTTVLDSQSTTYSTSISFSNLAGLELDGANLHLVDTSVPPEIIDGSSHNVFNVLSDRAVATDPGVPITIKAGDGGDTVHAGDRFHSLDFIGNLAVQGSAGTHLILDDAGTLNTTDVEPEGDGVRDVYTDTFSPSFEISGQGVTRHDSEVENDVVQIASPPETIEQPGYPIRHPASMGTFTFSNLDTLEVDGSTFSAGQGSAITSAGQGWVITPTDNSYYVNQTGDAPAHTLIKTGGGDEMISLQATTGPVEIDGGTSTNTLNVGSAANTLDAIQGALTVTGQGGSTTLNIHDESTSSTEFYNVIDNQVQRTPFTFGQPVGNPTQTISYVNIPVVNLYGGNARDLFGVTSTQAGSSLSLFGGTGGNEFIVDNDSDTLDDIHGPVAIHGGSRSDFAYAYDGLNTVGHTYTLTATDMKRDDIADISYDGLGQFILPTGDNPYFGHSPSSTVNVLSTAANTFTVVEVGGGDTINVGEPTGDGSTSTLLGIQGTLSVVGGEYQRSAVTVKLDDSGDTQTGKQVLFNTDSTGWGVSGLAPSQIYMNLGSGSSVQVAGGSPATGQSGGNTFTIQSAPVALSISGGTGNDGFIFTNTAPLGANVSLAGGGGNDTLQGPNTANTWQISAANAGTLDRTVSFSGMQNLLGGTANDTFGFQTGGSLSGTLKGGGGNDTLDYSAYRGDILVDLLLNTAGLIGQGAYNIANVTGSRGNDLIVGDGNANVLTGGTGRNVIIGEGGSNTITGGGSFNLLIGGTTIYDGNLPALEALMQYWDNPAATSLDQLVNPLKSKNGVTVNGQSLVFNKTTVQTNNAADSLIGGGGLNWFITDKDGDTINNGNGPGSNDRRMMI